MPGRSLADRITVPQGRSRSFSPARANGEDDFGRRGGDRYRPGGNGTRSRSPLPNRRREGGRRPGARREAAADNGRGGAERGGRQGRNGRPRKTQEELDDEMADYFNDNAAPTAAPTDINGAGQAAAQASEDTDMIE
jgi:THO complex subunit 4